MEHPYDGIIKKKWDRVGEMALQGDTYHQAWWPELDPRGLMREGKNQLLQVDLWPSFMHMHAPYTKSKFLRGLIMLNIWEKW